jgi:rod shape-determining protein MreB
MLAQPRLALDLGTANTVVYRRGDGVVLFEPTEAVVDAQSGEVQSVGRRMVGRVPAHLRALRPLRHGVVADAETTEAMLRYFLARLVRGSRKQPAVTLCVSSGMTQVERDAVTHAALAAGASDVWLIDETFAAAIGAELPVDEAVGSLVVDIGGGTTELAIVAGGGLVVSNSVRIGGEDFDAAIVERLREREQLLIGLEQAEALKIRLGSVFPAPDNLPTADVSGRDRGTGLVRRAKIHADEVRSALERPLARIVDALNDVIERAPPELLSDVSERGVVLVGGSSLLPGFDELLRRKTGLPVTIAERPLTAVAHGAGRILEGLPWRLRKRSRHSSTTTRRAIPSRRV